MRLQKFQVQIKVVIKICCSFFSNLDTERLSNSVKVYEIQSEVWITFKSYYTILDPSGVSMNNSRD